jgi:hypothetical protein
LCLRLVGLVEELVGLRPATRRDPKRDVSSSPAVQGVVGGDRRLDPLVGELLAPGLGGLQLLEVAYDLPVVEARVAEV